ncbi:uncharacterized protein LOC142168818 [Nicotiana tabacum]|uniref:Uncharacterized protein LOC142168818 n=1 Tax=Nicotiana tabacum TaxID=4097 RepID=A0AC58SM74_TOBAC
MEVIKWLDAEIIFPISDSNWISPVQCVPKKDGMTIVQNENNELISKRTNTGWLEGAEKKVEVEEIMETFPYEQLLETSLDATPWYADIANYLASGILPYDLSPV